MALHGQDLYVAIGRQIRHTSLAELKKGVENHGQQAATEYIEKKQHKVLEIQYIDFDVRRLVMNPDGNLLAIVGDEKIVVAALTKTVRQDPKNVNIKSFVVGEFYHINKGPSKIVKVLWHPLSKGYSHVLVLTHDSLLRMYDVAVNPDEPEQVFSFSEAAQSSGTYGVDTDNAASFCFGSKHSPWGQLSVYCLTQWGDIYMMCPVLPSTCLLDTSDLDDIRYHMGQEIAAGGVSKALVQAKRDWLDSLLDSLQPHPFSDEMFIAHNPVLNLARPARQGPFLYQPAPIELEDDDNRANDILYLETETAGVLAMAYSSGRVDICIVVDHPKPCWTLPRKLKSNGKQIDGEVNSMENGLPAVSVYESIDLGLLKIFGVSSISSTGGYSFQERRMGIPNHPVLEADPKYGDTFYVYHEAGAHCVSVRPWLEELVKINEIASQGANAELDARIIKFNESHIKSSVSCIVTTRPTKTSIPAPIVGFAVVTDSYLEYSLLLLTSSLQLIGLELLTRDSIENTTLPSTPTPVTSVVVQKENEYQNSLTQPGFGSQEGLLALNGLPLQPKIVLPPGIGSAKIVVTEENLQFLGKMVHGYRESLREVYTACDLAQQRLIAQENEYIRQQKSVEKCQERFKAFSSKIQDQADRQDIQAALQKKLMARADALLQKMKESREPELSAAEKEWGQEVLKRERAVKAFDERRHKVQTQYEILKRRIQELQGSIDDESSYSSTGFGRQSVWQKQKQPVKRYGTGQIQSVERSLVDE
ncbi:nuclear pore component-domain-containing protein [Lobosporangium transversale]|uniref:Nuclear pore component-domain-containing protein n=1 Tax=Lobosporangium transversale TaxID=64571 RepID=A0A1Y2GYE5_9FUNG|nr:nuclear pore component-domain-containing protein [Lobosporangium transversale]ORZ26791.1 nuclear pore component-domain-containing protein [Lobosporangium transversale]|eukprot:XP_021884554.1 nuclear pore component-domain-containing protein [Lobosporangium transversale]